MALNESKRHAEREKYLQQFYDEKLAADLAAVKESFALKLYNDFDIILICIFLICAVLCDSLM